jgi:SAM-dependent methyltransferase
MKGKKVNDFKTDWEQLYRDEFTPWDTGRPESHLMQTVTDLPVPPCSALDVGCGTGANAIWLAEQGFEVIGVDLSETAIKLSRERPGSEKCTFVHEDFLTAPPLKRDFGFVFDMGCFHTVHDDDGREHFARQVAASLAAKGLWLSICGSCDGPELGPPRLSALEITRAVEDYFEILFLKATYLDEVSAVQLEALELPPGTRPRAWSCLMEKRSIT